MHFVFRSARSNIDAHPSFRFSRSFLSQALKEELARIGLIVEVEFPPKTLLSRCAHLFFFGSLLRLFKERVCFARIETKKGLAMHIQS